MWNQNDDSYKFVQVCRQVMQIASGVAKNNVILQSGEQLLVMFQTK